MAAVDPTLAPSAQATGFLDSSVGKKVVMAVTGIVLSGFVTVHMLGNLQSYMGPVPFNHYAELLHTMIHGAGIWVFRAVMVVAVLLHAWMALSLTLANRAARPVGYRATQLQSATLASRTMRWTGSILGSFIKGDAYHNFVTGFQVKWTAAFYIVAQVCLGFHLWHGVWSLTQTLGWSHPRYNVLRRRIAMTLAVLVAGVNISFPIAVLTGLIH